VWAEKIIWAAIIKNIWAKQFENEIMDQLVIFQKMFMAYEEVASYAGFNRPKFIL
jgi:hypothetical protein